MTNIHLEHSTNKVLITNHENRTLEVTGFDPSDLLAAALAKCTTGTVKRFAQKSAYPLEDLKVRVELDRDRESKTAYFVVYLEMEGDLSEQQLRRLQKVADKSYIRRLLSQNIELKSKLISNGNQFEAASTL